MAFEPSCWIPLSPGSQVPEISCLGAGADLCSLWTGDDVPAPHCDGAVCALARAPRVNTTGRSFETRQSFRITILLVILLVSWFVSWRVSGFAGASANKFVVFRII